LQGTKSILKKDKKEPKGPNQNFGATPASVICDQISEIWPQKGQPGNPDSDEQYYELYNGNIA